MTRFTSIIERFLNGLVRFRSLAIVIVLVSTLFFGYFLSKINVENDTFKAIPPNLKAQIDYTNLKKEFPAPYNILFLAEFKAGTLREKIDSLNSWASAFAAIEGISGVSGLNSLQIPIKGGFFGVSSDYLVNKNKEFDEDLIRQRIRENHEFAKIFISDDESTFGMILGIKSDGDRNAIVGEVLKILERINRNPYIKSYMTSEGATSFFITRVMTRDFSILLPVCFLIVFLLLYRIFRRLLYVSVALAVNVVALVWTFGIMGMLNVTFTVVTSVIPIILFPIGVAGTIHILKSYTQHRRACGSTLKALGLAYRDQLKPCFLAAATTFAGFASFVFSEISWIRVFGIFTGIAVMLAFLFNIILIPLFISFEKSKKNSVPPTKDELKLDKFWDVFSRFALESKGWMALIPVLLILFYFGFRMVRVESNPILLLPKNNMLRLSDDFISKHFGGTRFFSVVLENNGKKLTEIEQWKEIGEITDFIEKQDGVGNVASVLPLLSRISMMLTGDSIARPAVTLLTAKSNMFGKSYSSLVSGFLSGERQKTRLNVICRSDEQTKALLIAENIEKYIRENHKNWSILVSGPAILNESMSTVLIETQVSSLISTVIPVLLCLILFFRSMRLGTFAIIPIILATATVYATMGVIGATINMVTVVIMNTCIGIGIDYAIHFASAFIYQYKSIGDRAKALRAAIKNKGTPILFNTLVVGIGFLVLIFSSFPPIRDFGILVFLSMIISAGFSMLFLSLLLLNFGIGKSVSVRKEML